MQLAEPTSRSLFRGVNNGTTAPCLRRGSVIQFPGWIDLPLGYYNPACTDSEWSFNNGGGPFV